MGKKSENGNVIELVIIGVLVLGIIGLLVWRFMDGQTKTGVASSQQTSQTTSSATLASYDPVVTPEVVQKLKSDTAAQKITYSYMTIGEWSVKVSTVNTANSNLPAYLDYRSDVTGPKNELVSVFVTNDLNGLSTQTGCAANNVQGVYVFRDQEYSAASYESTGGYGDDLMPAANLTPGDGHTYYVYKMVCGGKVSANTTAVANQLAKLTLK